MKLHPSRVTGPWKAGFVLDWHTRASQIVGHNEFGYPIFENTRSEVGELLYQFKYRNNQSALQKILIASIECLGQSSRGRFDLIVPVPPSNPARTVTAQLASGFAAGIEAEFSSTALIKCKDTSELKSVSDPVLRKQILDGAFCVDKQQTESKSVLLVDDLYRSGATLGAASEAVALQGGAKVVYVLAITRTRVHR